MFDADSVAIHQFNFTRWLRRLDIELDQITGGIGLTRNDFADWRYAVAFTNGIAPRQAAIDMLAEDHNGHGYLRHADIDNI